MKILNINQNQNFHELSFYIVKQKCRELEQELKKRDEKISDLVNSLDRSEEKFEKYFSVSERKLQAYEAMADMYDT